MFSSFLAALQFLSIVPVQRHFDEETVARSLLYFPLVGLVIGCLLIVIAAPFSDSDLLGAAVILCVWVIVTGGLHLDGLADSADAWAAGRGDKARALEVMKDPRCGPIAVVVIVLLMLLKFAALTVILEKNQLAVLLIAPVLGRTVVLALYASTPYVRESGLGNLYARYLDKNMILLVAGTSVLLSVFIVGIWPVLFAAVALVLLRWLMMQQIGGMTGDTIGASIELVEAIVLIAAALALS